MLFGIGAGASLSSGLSAASAGTQTMGAAAGSSGFWGGLGSVALGSAQTGSQGLFGSGGQFGLGQTFNTVGMGLGIVQAFSGQSVAGTGRYIGLTREGKKFEKARVDMIKGQLAGTNLAKPYIEAYRSVQKGRYKREGQALEKTTQGAVGGLASRRVGTGAGMRGVLSALGQEVEGKVAPERWDTSFKQQDFLKGVTGAQDIINQQYALAIARTRADASDAITKQYIGASQGQALGDLARYLAYMKYPPYQR